MKCVILQPSYIPWRGYFHQIQKADVFVFYDCVQYDKRGWRNRNYIKSPQGPQLLTIPVNARGSHGGLKIRDVRVADDKWRKKHLAAFELSYRKAPHWEQYRGLVEEILSIDSDNLSEITCRSTEWIAAALGIEHVRFVRSTRLDASGEKTDRLLDIVEKVGATHYISGPSARDYIEEDKFRDRGVTLEYMDYSFPEYPQLFGEFEPQVSVLDLLLNVGPEAGRYIWGDEADA